MLMVACMVLICSYLAPPSKAIAELYEGAGIRHTFEAEVLSSPPGSTAIVLDVGANNGGWTQSWELFAQRAGKEGIHVHLHMFEPQPSFRKDLQHLARRIPNATFEDAAVDKVYGSRSFFASSTGSVRSVGFANLRLHKST